MCKPYWSISFTATPEIGLCIVANYRPDAVWDCPGCYGVQVGMIIRGLALKGRG